MLDEPFPSLIATEVKEMLIAVVQADQKILRIGPQVESALGLVVLLCWQPCGDADHQITAAAVDGEGPTQDLPVGNFVEILELLPLLSCVLPTAARYQRNALAK